MASLADRNDSYLLGSDLEMYRRDYEQGYQEEEIRVEPDRPRNSFRQTGAEWNAWYAGSRWCFRCKLDVASNETGCPQCGDPVYGKIT